MRASKVLAVTGHVSHGTHSPHSLLTRGVMLCTAGVLSVACGGRSNETSGEARDGTRTGAGGIPNDAFASNAGAAGTRATASIPEDAPVPPCAAVPIVPPPEAVECNGVALELEPLPVDPLLPVTKATGAYEGCEYGFYPPPNWSAGDAPRMRLLYRTPDETLWELPNVASAAACNTSLNGGWYFDVADEPHVMIACPCSCAALGSVAPLLVLGCDSGPTIE